MFLHICRAVIAGGGVCDPIRVSVRSSKVIVAVLVGGSTSLSCKLVQIAFYHSSVHKAKAAE